MNQTIETILDRRSVRAYESTQISREELDKILECGNSGPVGANNRARYLVVQDSSLKSKLVEKAAPYYKKWFEALPEMVKERRKLLDKMPDPYYYGAPTIVFVIGKGGLCDYNCTIACQNIMLAARSLGIGSCWDTVGQLVIQDPSVKSELGLQEGENVYGPILLGYPRGNQFPKRPEMPDPQIAWR